jgi:hypothetical protein
MITRKKLELLRRCLYGEGDTADQIEADGVVDELLADLDMREAAQELPTPEQIDDMARSYGLDGDPFAS